MSHDQEKRPAADHALTPERHSPETGSSAEGRRQFIKKTIVTVPVILTVTSQPVWAWTRCRRCTISGQLSGNLSGPQDEDCGEGCTPGYWKNHRKAWCATGYEREDIYNHVFGVSALYNSDGSEMNLGTVIGHHGAMSSDMRLGQQAVAALLNAAHPGVDFIYTKAQVISYVQQVYCAQAQLNIELVKDNFDYLNNQGSPLCH
jgi:hypothetical protein